MLHVIRWTLVGHWPTLCLSPTTTSFVLRIKYMHFSRNGDSIPIRTLTIFNTRNNRNPQRWSIKKSFERQGDVPIINQHLSFIAPKSLEHDIRVERLSLSLRIHSTFCTDSFASNLSYRSFSMATRRRTVNKAPMRTNGYPLALLSSLILFWIHRYVLSQSVLRRPTFAGKRMSRYAKSLTVGRSNVLATDCWQWRSRMRRRRLRRDYLPS